ncbi:MAG: CBS domain-containing protein [Bacteriovoracaceae bacterium]|jgi:CBS domain-containing protein|nr:CBS domain-containing protein [Bacteriovoracaceae bacterium]
MENVPKVSEFMSKNFVYVTTDLGILEAIDVLTKNHVSNAPVIEKKDHQLKLLGFVTERDLLKFLSFNSFYEDVVQSKVEKIMKTHTVVIDSSKTIFECEEIFEELNLRHLPVIGEGGQLVGVVSRHDCLKAALDMYLKDHNIDIDHKKLLENRSNPSS